LLALRQKGLAGDFFEEVAEKDVAGVVVEELAAGLEVEGLVAESGDEPGVRGLPRRISTFID
jgi:hypothetical protein